MKTTEIQRLVKLEDRIRQIAEEFGLLTTDVSFEVVSADRMFEGIAYMFPGNFSHWSFGRDYERYRTIYEHTGSGIPYEVVWNFEEPRAFLVETNPFALNVLVIAHVLGHVDFFRGSRYLQRGREFSDVAQAAKNAAQRFAAYEAKYGQEEVEQVIDAGMSIMWHENPDPFFEEPDEDELRERILVLERAKSERSRDTASEFKRPLTHEEVQKIEKRLKWLSTKTPPEPTHDLLLYIMRHSPKPLKPWMEDVLSVLRSQARTLSPNRRTKMLDEGWATYWHVRIMRRLFEEGLLTPEEHGIFNDFHAKVTRASRTSFNWYRVGLALFEDVKERWDKGCFGRDYEECEDPRARSAWDTHAGQGDRKIFEVRSFYSDRMAVEELFSDEFIHAQDLYVYSEEVDQKTGDIVLVLRENRPPVIRAILKSLFTLYGTPLIVVENGNYRQSQQLLLRHEFSGYELDPEYRDATLMKICHLWGRPVHLEAVAGDKKKLFSCDGKDVREKEI